MINEERNTALYQKMFAEQESFRDWLKGQPPEEILNHAYEYTIREDILLSLEYHDLSDAQINALMNSPSPLADVFKDFEKLETDHMDTVWDCLENRADAILAEQRRVLREMPVYTQSGTYAHEHGELEQYRASNEANMACKQAVEDAIRDHYSGYSLDGKAAVAEVVNAFGIERTMYILANTVQQLGKSNVSHMGSAREPIELVYLVLSKFKYILLTAVLCATLAATYAFFIMKPIYAATAKLYIMGQDSSSILADLQIGSYLTMDYQEVFKTWEVHEMVREELSLSYSYKDMQDMLKVTNPSDTRVLYIIVKNADPHLATSMANAYAKAAKKFILETMDSEEPSTFSVALVPGTATGISRTGCAAIGLLVGTALAVVVILLKELLDTRPKTPEDIAQCADIPTLAIVPSTTVKLKQSKRRKYEST